MASYKRLAQSDAEAGDRFIQKQWAPCKRTRWIIGSGLSIAALVALAFYLLPGGKAIETCRQPRLRKEWRSLALAEQQQYIDAVLCLMQKPSEAVPRTYRFDDFAFEHVSKGADIHYAAAFLPWHRYFIHAYETALREECSYTGSLVYWDWSLDADDLAASPIWDIEYGFGRDGSADGPKLFGGRCVTDGPFANQTRHWQSKANGHGFDILESPHCLSRGFQAGDRKAALQARITPEAIGECLAQPNYSAFFRALEEQTHNSIPLFVRGDFYALTAPNDPVFYLHHTQIDRLWWVWQQEDPEQHMQAYSGPRENVKVHKTETPSAASLDDKLLIGQLAKPVRVRDVMSTQSELLCYTY